MSKMTKRATVFTLLAVMLAVGIACGAGAKDDEPNPDDVALAEPGVTHTPNPVVTGRQAKPSPTITTIADDGVLLVPEEVKPGTYRATVPADSPFCYWARLNAPTEDSIIRSGAGSAGDKMTVTIRKSDKGFHTRGCGVWVKIK